MEQRLFTHNEVDIYDATKDITSKHEVNPFKYYNINVYINDQYDFKEYDTSYLELIVDKDEKEIGRYFIKSEFIPEGNEFSYHKDSIREFYLHINDYLSLPDIDNQSIEIIQMFKELLNTGEISTFHECETYSKRSETINLLQNLFIEDKKLIHRYKDSYDVYNEDDSPEIILYGDFLCLFSFVNLK